MTTVLVLGAGSSMAFGYPNGKDLRDKILTLGKANNHALAEGAGLLQDEREFNQFLKAFRFSDQDSIDAFLATRREFEVIGKRSIATVLIRLEDERELFVQAAGDRWAAYLQNRLSAIEWDAWDYSKLKIVTFNYDRAFEHYLLMTLRYRYNKSVEDAVEKLRTLDIVHIYGSLGPTLPGVDGYRPYAPAVDIDTVAYAAESLKVIPEGRNSDPSLVQARELLSNAESIIFLGFAFDQTNMERLEATKTCAKRLERQTTIGLVLHGRNILATCKGMTVAEAQQAAAYFDKNSYSGEFLPQGFYDKRCEDFFRETLFLERIVPAVNKAI